MKKSRVVEIVSLVLEDRVIETVKVEAGTILCVGDTSGFELFDEYPLGEVIYKPLPPNSPLVERGILSIPAPPLPYENKVTLHTELCTFIAQYLTVSEDFRSVLATYLMLSWVYDAFSEVPYLRFQGNFGSGKTRGLLVSAALAAKSFNAGGASTISPIFHILDKYQGTLVLDEADFRFSDEKAEVVKILNNGNQRGFPVLRSMQNAKREFEPRAFSVFGPKIIAMRGSYDDLALESRFLSEDMNQLERGNGVPTQVPQEMKQEAEALRSKLLTYRLRNRFGLSLTGSPHPELSDRLNQIVFPLLSVAPNAEAKASIVKVAKRSAEKLSFEQAWSFEAEVLKAVVATDDAGDPLSVSQITKTLRLASGREFDSRLTPTLVGRTLRHRLGLSLYKTRGLVTVMPGQGETLRKLKERYL